MNNGAEVGIYFDIKTTQHKYRKSFPNQIYDSLRGTIYKIVSDIYLNHSYFRRVLV